MKRNSQQIVMPFSEEFSFTWNTWKDYKWASHKFKYKSVFSEQAALEQLVTLSENDEEKAIKIIKQSMRREWQGLFPLHETTTGNGKSKQSNSKKPETGTGESLTDRVKRATINKFSGGGSSGDGPNLKAV